MKGQALIETLLGLSLMMLFAVAAVVLMISLLGKVILVRWSEENSRCIAQTEDHEKCEALTKAVLHRRFYFKDVDVSDQILQGIIHTHTEARMLGRVKIKVNYDLGPSEYKRVRQ